MTISIQTIPKSDGHGGSLSCLALYCQIRKSEEKAMHFMLIGNDVAKQIDERVRGGEKERKRQNDRENRNGRYRRCDRESSRDRESLLCGLEYRVVLIATAKGPGR